MKIIGKIAKYLINSDERIILARDILLQDTIIEFNVFYNLGDDILYFSAKSNNLVEGLCQLSSTLALFRERNDYSHIWKSKLKIGENNIKIYINNEIPTIEVNGVVYENKSLITKDYICRITMSRNVGVVKINESIYKPVILISDISAEFDSLGINRKIGDCGFWNQNEQKFYSLENSCFEIQELTSEVATIETNEANGIIFNGKYESINDDNNKFFPILKGKKIKEIWFNRNLIWKLKTLIEGVDYQCYDWLKGDGYAWIETNKIMPQIRLRLLINLIFHRQFSSKLTFMAITSRDSDWTGADDTERPIISLNPRNDEMRYYVDLTSTRTYVPFKYDQPMSFDYSQKTYNKSKSSLNLFATQRLAFGNEPMVGDMSKLVISGIDQDYYFSLYPCQLLTPILPQFASDNKPHPKGECGMIDKLTGIFYGNANTTGSFSVYND